MLEGGSVEEAVIIQAATLIAKYFVYTAVNVAKFAINTLLAEHDVTAEAVDMLKCIITKDLLDDFLPSKPNYRLSNGLVVDYLLLTTAHDLKRC